MALSLSPERTWSALGWGNVLLITGVLTVALIHDAARPSKEGKRETILTRARSFDWSSYVRDLPYQKWNLLYFLIAAIVWSCATPRLERAAELRADWIAFVVVRNLVILWGWYEPLHRYLYVGPRRHQFVKEGKKFNPEFPPVRPPLPAHTATPSHPPPTADSDAASGVCAGEPAPAGPALLNPRRAADVRVRGPLAPPARQRHPPRRRLPQRRAALVRGLVHPLALLGEGALLLRAPLS